MPIINYSSAMVKRRCTGFHGDVFATRSSGPVPRSKLDEIKKFRFRRVANVYLGGVCISRLPKSLSDLKTAQI